MSERPDPHPLRLGLIGAGPWGRNYIRTIDGLDGVRLSRLASRNPDSTGLVDPGCKVGENWRDLMEADALDGVIIASPPATHAEMILAAIQRGLPVLVEKPMALSPADAEKVLVTAQAEDAIVMVDHIHLYSAAWEAVRREARALGPVRAISGVAGKWGPFPPKAPVLWDWGSHDVAMCIDLMGRSPELASAIRIESPGEFHTDSPGDGETLALSLDFGDANARISISSLYRQKSRLFTIAFEKGELVYDDTLAGAAKVRLKTSPQDPGGTFKLSPGTPMERAVLAFRNAILRGVPESDDAALGAQVVGTLARLEQSLA